MKETLKSDTSVAFDEATRMATGADTTEMRLTGLILAQSALIGVAVGIFDKGIWLPAGATENEWVNGMTYSMGALAIQILAYYIFKMFFEQQMQEKVRMGEMQRQRSSAFREQQWNYDQRRVEMELRMQEMQLEKELLWMQANPGQAFPEVMHKTGVNFNNEVIPNHTAIKSETLSMGLDNITQVDDTPVPPSVPGVILKADGTPDLRYTKGSGKV